MGLPDYRDKTVCVTGGAGFIGSHLVRGLVRAGASVRILDDLSTGSRNNLVDLPPHVELVEGSILDRSARTSALEGAEVVFHHAARVSVPESLEDPAGYRRTNVDGTLSVLEAAAAAGTARLVYAGSCSAYGDLPGLPKREGDPVQPGSPYAATKLEGEELVAAHPGVSPGLDTVRLRYFNVYGPGQAHDSAYAAAIPRFIRAVATGGNPTVFGDGLQTRDFIHVEDVVRANLLAGSATGSLGGTVLNIGSGHRRSILDVLEAISAGLGRTIVPDHLPARSGEVRDSEASIELARERLGFEPQREFTAAIVEMVRDGD